MALRGGEPQRVSFGGSYNISPAISPDGRTMAYVTRDNWAFKLTTMDLGSGNIQPLTDTKDDESPSFAPNGAVVIYAAQGEQGAELATVTVDGRIRQRLSQPGDVRDPAWSTRIQ